MVKLYRQHVLQGAARRRDWSDREHSPAAPPAPAPAKAAEEREEVGSFGD